MVYEYECSKCGVMEIIQGIKDDILEKCPDCSSAEFTKLISLCGGIIIAGREVNQYSDILRAKYWRDKNGVRHKVGPGDGHSGSGTVTEQTVSPEGAKARTKRERRQLRMQRLKPKKPRKK